MRFIFVAGFALAALIGCTTTAQVKPSELGRLDGYDVRGGANAAPVLETIKGEQVSLGADSKLVLDLPGGRIGGRFTTIEVHDGQFAGRTDDARIVQVSTDEVRGVAVEEPNHTRTIGAVVGVTALLLVLAGAYVLATAETSQTVSGRPLRARGKVVTAPLAVREGASDGWRGAGPVPDVSSLSRAAREVLADEWTANARAEHASVPAFSRLSLTLVSLGAPARLVEAAHRAALEEIEHARLAFALAGAFAGAPAAPGALTDLWRERATTATSLLELATESLVDGCLNEGHAAAVATAAAARARDAALCAAWAAIARDESSHAALAWEIVRWCLEQAGPDLGRPLRKAIHTIPAPAGARPVPSGLDVELAAHGWLRSEERQALFEEVRLSAASRLAALLAERPPEAT